MLRPLSGPFSQPTLRDNRSFSAVSALSFLPSEKDDWKQPSTVGPQWLEHLWDQSNLFEIRVVRATHGARSGST